MKSGNAGPDAPRVLVADDNATIRAHISRVLGPFYRIETAADGASALAAAQKHAPDLVLSDMSMTGPDGASLVKSLRADVRTLEIPVIVLPASAEAGADCLAAGADDFLAKPFAGHELLARVRAVLRVSAVRREAALRERHLRAESEAANAWLNLALSAARMVAWQWDFSRNDGARGSQADEVLGFPPGTNVIFRERIHPEDRARVHAARLEKPQGQNPPDLEYRLIDANGQDIWVADTCRVVCDTAGQPIGLTGVAQDVTARKQAETALLASEAELRQLNATLETMVAERTAERDRIWQLSQDLFLVMDFAGVIQSANPAWTAVLGYAPSDLTGTCVTDFVHPEDVPRAILQMRRLREAVLPRDENRCRHRDGSWRWISWTAVSEGRLIYSVGRDVTAEKQQAEALAKTEEALRQAQKMEAVGQLTGGIAHDFNNMLQGISGGVELMRRRIAEGRPQEAERFVAAAQKSIERAAALTYRLLAFSRRQTLLPKPVDPSTLIAGIGALIRQTIGPTVTFEMRLLDKSWPVRCDPNQLENALLNLAINARDAMPDGGVLTIETAHAAMAASDITGTPEAAPGDYVVITVRDTGMGMAPDVLARAFEPFYTTKPPGQGTGLGLSQVYGFVSQSEGLVRLESVAGAGTSVKIYLPRYAGADDEPWDDAAGREFLPPRRITGATVLLVEDEADLRLHAREALEEIGCQVIETGDGPSALNALRDAMSSEAGGIDMLISDVGLPGGLNGRQLADAAREMLPNLPILLITGYSSALEPHTLSPGVAYLGKPFALESLTAKVRSMLRG